MDEESIKALCKQFNIIEYHINPDMTVDVNQNVNISNRRLSELPLQFGRIEGYFTCSDNQLTSLKGSPHMVSGSFYCNHNILLDLKHSPTSVGGDYMCNSNLLTSLDGVPFMIHGSFYCGINKLVSFDSFPPRISGQISMGIQVDATDYFPTILRILDSEHYPFYDSVEKARQILSPMQRDAFDSWIDAQRRIDTINEIINYDDHTQ